MPRHITVSFRQAGAGPDRSRRRNGQLSQAQAAISRRHLAVAVNPEAFRV
jgi:hypothetical protein